MMVIRNILVLALFLLPALGCKGEQKDLGKELAVHHCDENPTSCNDFVKTYGETGLEKSARTGSLEPIRNKAKRPKKILTSQSSKELRAKNGDMIDIGDARRNFEFSLALFNENKPEAALAHLLISAESGLPEARYYLADLHESGSVHLNADLFEAYVWFRSVNSIHRRAGSSQTFSNADQRASDIENKLSPSQIQEAEKWLQDIRQKQDQLGFEFGEKLIRLHLK